MIEPKFEMLDAWRQFADTIHDPADRLAFYDSVAKYGLYCTEPQGLNPSLLEYFCGIVKPTIDRQHKEQERKKILNARRAAKRKEQRARRREQINAIFTILHDMKGGCKQ